MQLPGGQFVLLLVIDELLGPPELGLDDEDGSMGGNPMGKNILGGITIGG